MARSGISRIAPERVEVGVARRVEVEPEELLALVQRADRVEIDGVENLHPAPPKLAAAPDSGALDDLGQHRFGLGAADWASVAPTSAGASARSAISSQASSAPRTATAAPMRRPSLRA